MTDQLRILIKEIIGLVTHPSIMHKKDSSDSENPEGEENDQENSEETPS